MLTTAADTYLAVRRASGFALRNQGFQLKSFAAFSEGRGYPHIRATIAIEWAGLGRSRLQRARRLGTVIRFACYLHAEDERHEVPPAIFGSENARRPTPYVLTTAAIRQLITAVAQSMPRAICGATYSTLFALLACTGLRVSEASAAYGRHHARRLGDSTDQVPQEPPRALARDGAGRTGTISPAACWCR